MHLGHAGRNKNTMLPFDRYYVPEKYKDEGRFWWVAQSMAYVFRLTKEMKDMVEAAKKEMGYRHPIMAMQVRQGDSCIVRSMCYGLPQFMVEAKKMRDLYGVKRIFLATDSYKVIAQTKYFPDYEFVYQHFDRRCVRACRLMTANRATNLSFT
jgi:hypothetical protein